jgi:hypothetical protein
MSEHITGVTIGSHMPSPRTRPRHALRSPVFADPYGVRRRVVVTGGLLVGLALVGWLGLLLISVASIAVGVAR